jgi:outer membrane receptor protein involved in Fe transport
MSARGLRTLASLAATLGAIFAAPFARAENALDLEAALSERVVTTASKSAEGSTVAPATTTSFSGDDLRKYGARSLGEALNLLSLGVIHHPDEGEIGARGVLLKGDNGQHVLVLLDGHVLNDQQDAANALMAIGGIPLEIIDHVEVVLGPGSVLYGGNAMLGVINVVTKRAKDFQGAHFVTELSYAPGADRGGALRAPGFGREDLREAGFHTRSAIGAGVPFELFGRKGGLTFEAQWTRHEVAAFTFGPAGRERPFFRETTTPTGVARFTLGRLEGMVRAASSDVRRSSELFPIRTDGAQGPPGEGGRSQRVNVDLKYTHPVSAALSVSARLFGDVSRTDWNTLNYEGLYNCPAGMLAGCVRSTTTLTRWIGTELQGHYDWKDDGSISTLVGAVAILRQVGISGIATEVVTGDSPGSFLYEKRLETAGALYLQQVVRANKRLTFNAGARFDYEQRFGTHLSPRAAVVYSPWERGAVKLVYSEAFRGPTVVESFYQDPKVFIRAGELDAETVRSIESSIEQTWGTQKFFYGVFGTRWNNLVFERFLLDAPGADPADRALVRAAKDRGDLTPTTTSANVYENFGSIWNYGMNTGFEGSSFVGRLQYGVNVAIAQATSEGRGLANSGRAFGNARVAYDFGHGWPTLALAGQWSAFRMRQKVVGHTTQEPERPAQLALRATLTGPITPITGLSYRASFDYGFHPYMVAGLPYPPDRPVRELRPADRYTVMLGLQYDLVP